MLTLPGFGLLAIGVGMFCVVEDQSALSLGC